MVSLDVKHHVYLLRVQEVCESRGDRPSLPSLTSLRFCGRKATLSQPLTRTRSESRRDQEEGGELDSYEEVRHFWGSRRDQEEGGGAGPLS